MSNNTSTCSSCRLAMKAKRAKGLEGMLHCTGSYAASIGRGIPFRAYFFSPQRAACDNFARGVPQEWDAGDSITIGADQEEASVEQQSEELAYQPEPQPANDPSDLFSFEPLVAKEPEEKKVDKKPLHEAAFI